MNNKRMGIILILLSILVLVIILCSTIFSVSIISINYMSSKTVNIEDSALLENAGINPTGSIFLVNKSEIIKKIQTYEPKLKVVNVESVFPNKLVLNIIEKEPFYVINSSIGYIICDENLETISLEETFSNTKTNPIELENVNIEENFEIGMQLKSAHLEIIKDISYCLREWELNTNIILGNISKITIDHIKENQLHISMFNGTNILIENINTNMSNKINSAFSYYDNNQKNNGTIKIIDCEDGYSRLIFVEN